MKKLIEAYTIIVEHLKNNTNNKEVQENFQGTPARCVKALIESTISDLDISSEIEKVIKTVFPVAKGNSALGMITQGPIVIDSICPHHLATVRYEAYVSYLPTKETVLGLSKLARIAKVLGKRPVLQEQLAADIVDVLHKRDTHYSTFPFPSIISSGSAVLLVGLHTCMSSRGVHEDALTAIVDLRGLYKENGFEQKFYSAVESIRHAKPF